MVIKKVSSLTQQGIEPESTISAADACFTQHYLSVSHLICLSVSEGE